MSFFSYHGGTNPDAINYLLLARTDGMYLKDLFSPDGQSFFSVWPMGYPLFIRFVSYLVPADILIASKVANLLLILLTLYFIKKCFKRDAYLYAMLFLTDSFVRITYMTWSEVPFSLSLLILAISLHRYYTTQHISWLIAVFLSASFAFLSRYIGLYTLAPISITALMFLSQKNYRHFFATAFCAFFILAVATLYLWMNYLHTGHMTGLERMESIESHTELLTRLVLHQLREIKFFIIVGVIYFLYLRIRQIPFKRPGQRHKKLTDTSWLFLLMVGGIYWLSIVIVRWNFHFDSFGNRFLAPATLLFSFAALNYILQYPRYREHVKRFLVLMVGIVLTYHLIIWTIQHKAPVFSQIWQQKKERYSSLPDSSILIFSDLDIMYYNPNIQPAAPFPYSGQRAYDQYIVESINDGESISEYASRLCHQTSAHYIYIDALPGMGTFYANKAKLAKEQKTPLHESFEHTIQTIDRESITLLRECHR